MTPIPVHRAPATRRGALTLLLLAALLLLPRSAPAPHSAPGPHAYPAHWSLTGALPQPLAYGTATLLPSGQVLVAGGNPGTAYNSINQATLYDPATGTFSALAPMANDRMFHTATLLRTGQVLIAGGENDDDIYSGQHAITNTALYDPATRTFTPTGPLLTPRDQAVAVRLPSGVVLVAGGCRGTGFGCTTGWSSAELYDPASGTFTVTGAMATPRIQATATLLRTGQILVVGGSPTGGAGSLSSAELYNPATGTFTLTRGQLHVGRTLHTATLLPDGEVLIAGGCSQYGEECYPRNSALSSTELYNPMTQTFRWGPAMSGPRYNQFATLLPSGLVLLAGGGNGGGPLASAELYNWLTGRFTATAAMVAAQESPLGTLLRTGQVLLAGGCYDANGSCAAPPLTTAELYTP